MRTLSEIWDFFQSEILGMAWFNPLVGRTLAKAGIDTGSRMGASLQFFIYDVIKIMVLLGFLIFIISYIQSYFPPERTKKSWGAFTDWAPMQLRHCWEQSLLSVPARQFPFLWALPAPVCLWGLHFLF